MWKKKKTPPIQTLRRNQFLDPSFDEHIRLLANTNPSELRWAETYLLQEKNDAKVRQGSDIESVIIKTLYELSEELKKEKIEHYTKGNIVRENESGSWVFASTGDKGVGEFLHFVFSDELEFHLRYAVHIINYEKYNPFYRSQETKT